MTAAAAEAKQAAQAHKQVLTALATQLQQLAVTVTQSAETTPPVAFPAPAAAPCLTDTHEPWVGTPERYGSDRETCGPFFTNCSLPFTLQPHTFTTETAKVAFINHLGFGEQQSGTDG